MTATPRVRRLRWTACACAAVALVLPALLLAGFPLVALVLLEQVVLTIAAGATVLWFIASTLPPIAAAWFLGYREATEQPDGDDGDGGRRLSAVS